MIYTNLYHKFISSRPKRVKVPNDCLESHHIIPRSLGGTNAKDNLIVLTAREHFIAHLLLWKMSTGNAKYKMANALWYMSHLPKHKRHISSRQYAILREEHGVISSNRNRRLWADPIHKAKRSASISRAKKDLGHITAEHTKSVWANHTQEERASRSKNITKGKKQGWSNKSAEYKADYSSRLKQGHKNMDPIKRKIASDKMRAYWRDPIQRAKRIASITKAGRLYRAKKKQSIS